MASSTATVQAMAARSPKAAVAAPRAKPCDVPERQERCRADAPFGDEAREGVEVVLFLGLHVAEDVALWPASEHGELALVDALGTVLAGMGPRARCARSARAL